MNSNSSIAGLPVIQDLMDKLKRLGNENLKWVKAQKKLLFTFGVSICAFDWISRLPPG